MSELLTIAEVASVLKCSDYAVVKRFAKLPGVIDLGRAETRHKRRYRVLRIPKAVVEKYLADKSGHPVQIKVPERAERRRRSPNWRDKTAMNLAKSCVQNGCTQIRYPDRGILTEIADKARMLTFIPDEPEWAEILAGWIDDDKDIDSNGRIIAVGPLKK